MVCLGFQFDKLKKRSKYVFVFDSLEFCDKPWVLFLYRFTYIEMYLFDFSKRPYSKAARRSGSEQNATRRIGSPRKQPNFLLSAVYLRFICGTTAALRFSVLTNEPTPICPCNLSLCKTCLKIEFSSFCEIKNSPSKPKIEESPQSSIFTRTHHGRVGTGRRTAGQRGGAGTGSTGRRRVGSPRRQPSLSPSRQSKTTLLSMSLEARISAMRNAM